MGVILPPVLLKPQRAAKLTFWNISKKYLLVKSKIDFKFLILIKVIYVMQNMSLLWAKVLVTLQYLSRYFEIWMFDKRYGYLKINDSLSFLLNLMVILFGNVWSDQYFWINFPYIVKCLLQSLKSDLYSLRVQCICTVFYYERSVTINERYNSTPFFAHFPVI